MNIHRLIRLLEKFDETRIKSTKTAGFDKDFAKLPANVQALARETFHKWMNNPAGTDFRALKRYPQIYRISVGYRYRAMAEKTGENSYRWFAIVSHEAYNKMY